MKKIRDRAVVAAAAFALAGGIGLAASSPATADTTPASQAWSVGVASTSWAENLWAWWEGQATTTCWSCVVHGNGGAVG